MVAVVTVAVVVVMVAKVLVWAEATVDMLVEGLVIGVRVGGLTGVNVDSFAVPMTVLEFSISTS